MIIVTVIIFVNVQKLNKLESSFFLFRSIDQSMSNALYMQLVVCMEIAKIILQAKYIQIFFLSGKQKKIEENITTKSLPNGNIFEWQ